MLVRGNFGLHLLQMGHQQAAAVKSSIGKGQPSRRSGGVQLHPGVEDGFVQWWVPLDEKVVKRHHIALWSPTSYLTSEPKSYCQIIWNVKRKNCESRSEGSQWMSRLLFSIIRNVMSVSLSQVSKITRRFFAITVTHLYISTDTFSVDLCIIVYVIPQSFMFSFLNWRKGFSCCKLEADVCFLCQQQTNRQVWIPSSF